MAVIGSPVPRMAGGLPFRAGLLMAPELQRESAC